MARLSYLLDTNVVSEPVAKKPDPGVMRKLEAHGSTVALPAYTDLQIAAIAATNGLVLVTRNLDDFRAFEGLAMENWFSTP
ncbi:MAG: hypothetical protein K9L32_01455 [Chromatiaceae bacterium]|nr:hypothetical protein [Chromatiaceae bacterium]MCF8002871.1 hypothetical protein [Chromatiaceae bacterium]